jgi:hypothetical protein
VFSLRSEFGVLIQYSGTLLKFSPCSTFRLYLLHFRMSCLLSNLPLPEGRASTARGPASTLHVVSHTDFTFSLSLSLCLHFQSACVNKCDIADSRFECMLSWFPQTLQAWYIVRRRHSVVKQTNGSRLHATLIPCCGNACRLSPGDLTSDCRIQSAVYVSFRNRTT